MISGLYNLGTNCFINSVCQVLAYSEVIFQQGAENEFEQIILGELDALRRSNDKIYNNKNLLTYIFQQNNEFMNQYDAHEFVLWLADRMPSLQITTKGQLTSQKICNYCKYKKRAKNQEFHQLIVPFQQTLQQQLKYIYNEESYYCKKCKSNSININYTVYEQNLPDLLMVQYARSDHFGSKDLSNISFEHIQGYDLFAFINHIGTPKNGHYTACVKKNNIWYLFDDDLVRQTPPQYNSNSAYLIFYVKQQ